MTVAGAEVSVLEVRGVTKTFPGVIANEGVDLTLHQGEIHCLLGENGAGKSTLCNLVYGVYRPDAGDMRLAGEPHRPAGPAQALAQGIAMVHQHFSLVADMTVVENLMLGQSRGVLRQQECASRVR